LEQKDGRIKRYFENFSKRTLFCIYFSEKDELPSNRRCVQTIS